MRSFDLIRIAIWVLLSTGVGAHAFPITELRSEGLTPDQWDQAKGVSGLLPGDEYEKIRADHARDRIRDHFVNKGYPSNEVTVDLTQRNDAHVLKFTVKLGVPLKLAGASFFTKEGEITKALEKRLIKEVDVKPGELFDRDRIKEMKRSIEIFLTAQSFIDSRVKEITTDPKPEGIQLRFELELGQKVVFSVEGNQYFSRAELVDLISDQRLLGLGRDYVAVVSNRIRDHYIDRGYRKVHITPYFFEAHGLEPKKVLFKIDEGPQIQIRSLIFDGNEVFDDEELRVLFYKGAPDRIRAKIHNGKMVEAAAATLIEQLRKRGYLSAKLIGIKTDDEPDGQSVKVRIFLNEGSQTRVQSVAFHGNSIFPVERLEKSFGLVEGEPLDLSRVEDGIDRIKRDYRNAGYLDFKFLNENGTSNSMITYSEKNQLAYLDFEINEGEIFRLSGIEIFGNESTKRFVIEREILLKDGDPLSEDKILEIEERLRRLGIFSQVNIELKDLPKEPHLKTLKITIQETVPGNTTAGIGFRNDLGIRAFGGLSYSNLWGLNHTWALDLTVNRRLSSFQFLEYTAQVSYTLPWAFAGATTLRPSISAEKRQYLEFDAETFAFNTVAERMLYRPLRLSGSLGYTLERIRQFNAIDPTQDQQITIGSLTPNLRLDLRDNPLTPKKGFFASTSFEYANSFLGTQTAPVPVSYGRLQGRTDFYFNFVPELVLYFSLRGGWLKNFEDPYRADGTLDPRVTVPLIKQFALGGVNSIRGFTEQEINVQAKDPDRRVQGYLTYVNYRTQVDFYPSPQVSIGPFLDAGNLQVDAFNLGNLRFGSGFGFRYVTPVGPVNFDWGFKLFPRPGEATNVFYFSLGVI